MSIKNDICTPNSTNRLHRYRKNHTRIDYYPSPDVMAMIEHHLANSEEKCMAGIIDGLIRSGYRAIVSGNGWNQKYDRTYHPTL